MRRDDSWDLIKCSIWDALVTTLGCELLQREASATAERIINHKSVLAVTDTKFYKLLGCSMCEKFDPEYDPAHLDKVIQDCHEKSLATLEFIDVKREGRSRYKRWYDKHGKEDKRRRRELDKAK